MSSSLTAVIDLLLAIALIAVVIGLLILGTMYLSVHVISAVLVLGLWHLGKTLQQRLRGRSRTFAPVGHPRLASANSTGDVIDVDFVERASPAMATQQATPAGR